MTEERLETAFNDGIGLSNVNERLRVIYGARSTLRLASSSAAARRSASRSPTSSPRSAPVPDDLHLRAVVVDDEQLARDELCYLLDEVGGVEVVGQAGNGLEALEAIGRSQPDLVFLDVQMPGLTGFEVARRLVDREPPITVIFVTAYDQHAIEAFEVNAVDYLLKPIEAGRLETAIQRARRRMVPACPDERPARAHRPTHGDQAAAARAGGREGGRTVPAGPGRGHHLCLDGRRVD